MLVQFSRMKNDEKSFQKTIFILILCEKGYSEICYSDYVGKNSVIENEDISIIPGHFIYTITTNFALTGEGHGHPDYWIFPCGILSYKIISKVRTQKNKNFQLSYFFLIFHFPNTKTKKFLGQERFRDTTQVLVKNKR